MNNIDVGHIISGEEFKDNGEIIEIINPTTEEKIAKITSATEDTIDKAIKSSLKAQKIWQTFSLAKRTQILFEFKELLEKNEDTITRLISKDLGKVYDDAKGELRRGIENVEYACGVGEILKGEYNKNISSSIDSWSEFSPVGVVLGITPFNFPAMIPLWMFPLALAAGNSFILKPSEKDPLATIFITKLFNETKAPKGLLNLINGQKDQVKKMLEDERINAVSFVGSTEVARQIYTNSTKNGKRCQALGGAKNHALVLSDAKISQATDQLISAAFGSSGQRCMALSVVMVEKKIKKLFLDDLITKVKNLKVGFQKLESNSYGPLVSDDHLNNVQNYIKLAEDEGSEIILDGREINDRRNSYKKGYFLGPTVIDSVKPNMKSYLNEIFGPVLQIIEIDNIEEGIQIINQNSFGNGCCIFTENGNYAREFSEKVDIGMVGVNIPLPVPSSFHSFGGWKNSLFGDLNIYGPDGLRFYTRRKTITQRWFGNSDMSEINLSMPSNQKN